METIDNLNLNLNLTLTATLIHSLWQALLIYLFVRIIFLAFPKLTAMGRYHILLGALAGMVLWSVYTFFSDLQVYSTHATPIRESFNLLPGSAFLMESISEAALTYQLENYLPYLVVIYLCGVLINLLKLGIAWHRIRLIRQSLISAAILQRKLDEFLPILNVKKPVKAFFSQLVDVPCVVGYFKPVLLLPVTFTTNLSAAEAEAIILHELAHIKHNDYLLNILQQVVSVVFFFNPFARIMSKMVDTERELSCDDVVVNFTGAPVVYASALIKLEQTRQMDLPLALAATGKKYKLFLRIEHLLKPKTPAVNAKHLLFTTLLFISSIGSIAWLNPEIKNGTVISENGAEAINKIAQVFDKISQGRDELVAPKDTVPIYHPKTSESGGIGVKDDKVYNDNEEGLYYSDKDKVYKDRNDDKYYSNNDQLYKSDDDDKYYSNNDQIYGRNGDKYNSKSNGLNTPLLNFNTTNVQPPANSAINGVNYNSARDDLYRKKVDRIREAIRNMPEWKSESDAFRAEYYNSAAWKKHYASSAESLKILGDHPGPKEYEIWREVVSRANAEMESSEAYKVYEAKIKDFNKRLDLELRRQLANEAQ